MKKRTLIQRSLRHYWRTHLAVLLGVVAGTAVISGALIVGDSVRESLKQMSLDRLGKIDFAIHSHRFFRQDLAGKLPEADKTFRDQFETPVPALILDGALVRESSDGTVLDRAGRIRVYGIDERFAAVSELTKELIPTSYDDEETLESINEVVLSHRVASQIGAKPGDKLKLFVELPSNIPRDSLLGDRDAQQHQEINLTVKTLLPPTSAVGRFDLDPGQQLPLTIFVPLAAMQLELELSEVAPSREFRQGRPARINAIFLASNTPELAKTEQAVAMAEKANVFVGRQLQLADVGLRIAQHDGRGYISIESEQLVLDAVLSELAVETAEELGLPHAESLAYLVNDFVSESDSSRKAIYSVAAGVDFEQLAKWPGEKLLDEGASLPTDDEIVLDEWIAEDLGLKKGDSIRLKYFLVDNHGGTTEKERVFKVHSVVPLEEGRLTTDRGLVPAVRGITDVKDFRDLRQPFPMNLDPLTDRDDTYWAEHGPTPKVFLPLAVAQEMWETRHGRLTSIRVFQRDDEDLGSFAKKFEERLLSKIDVKKADLAFLPVKHLGVEAASGTTDFTGLFFGFSFFVIASAMILIGLLFGLGVERRVKELGLLEAIGFNRKQVRGIVVWEAAVVSVFGAVLGSAAAVVYANLMIFALKDPDWWGGAIGTRFLDVYVTPTSLVAGFAISVIVALLAVLAALRSLKPLSPRDLLHGVTLPAESAEDLTAKSARRAKIARFGFLASIIVAVLGVARLIPSSEATFGMSWQVIAFFCVGMTMLVCSLCGLSSWLMTDRQSAVTGRGTGAIMKLGLRNAARHRSRSVLSAGLIAFATFVIVAVASGRRDPSVETPDFSSGNGGFQLVAETSSPILFDLNTEDGRDKLNFSAEADSPDAKLLAEMTVESFRVKPGENASCLNLYKTSLPTVLGVPDSLIERGGFRFINGTDDDWKLLTEPRDDGRIPVLGDMNTLMYSLKKGPGQTIEVPGAEQELVVVGMLDSSVFQGVLLMSTPNFDKLFPEQTGFSYFLIGAGEQRIESGHSKPEVKNSVEDLIGAGEQRIESGGYFSAGEQASLSTHFESGLTEFGLDTEPVTKRIAAFLVVQNTYLSTFQTLGGLGLLLGTLGLATVMLRNVVERRSELALLRAVGFPAGSLGTMVLAENAMLLTWGLATGTMCAVVSMSPHLASVGADTDWLGVAGLLLVVFAVGMAAAFLAVREAVRTPIVATLRGE
jgi:ABC-type lipoprotein release transport system permease subunit